MYYLRSRQKRKFKRYLKKGIQNTCVDIYLYINTAYRKGAPCFRYIAVPISLTQNTQVHYIVSSMVEFP